MIEANGIRVHCRRTGGDKPPIVLLHGLTADGGCWLPVARGLERDFDVVMPDARGHGSSDAPERGYTYEALAADVVGLFDALGLAAPVLVGHSMGGLTAALVAARHPRRVSALVLVDPTFLSPEQQRAAHQAGLVTGRSYEQLLADLRLRHPRRSEEMLELLARARSRTQARAFDILSPPNPDYREQVDALQMPALLIIGDSGVVSPAAAAELAKRNPRLQVEQVAPAGHGLPYDQPERLAERIRTYAALHSPSAQSGK